MRAALITVGIVFFFIASAVMVLIGDAEIGLTNMAISIASFIAADFFEESGGA